MDATNVLEVAVKEAIMIEQKGYAHYLSLAKRTEDPLSERLFRSLAAQEVDHEKRIKHLYENLDLDEENYPPVDENTKSSIEQIMRATFDSLRDATPAGQKDIIDTEGYELAMHLERESIRAYDQLLGQSKTKTEKELFGALRDQEEEHLVSLENVYAYLTDSEDWFKSDESSVWNWMNM